MTTPSIELRKRKLAWHARRGLLELDCLIQPFMRLDFGNINDEEVVLLEALFALEDPDLLVLLMNPEQATTLSLAERQLIGKILNANT